MEDELQEKLIQVLQTFDVRLTGVLKQVMQLGVTVEFLTEKLFEDLDDKGREALEKEFEVFRNIRFAEIQAEWQKLKEQAVNLQD